MPGCVPDPVGSGGDGPWPLHSPKETNEAIVCSPRSLSLSLSGLTKGEDLFANRNVEELNLRVTHSVALCRQPSAWMARRPGRTTSLPQPFAAPPCAFALCHYQVSDSAVSVAASSTVTPAREWPRWALWWGLGIRDFACPLVTQRRRHVQEQDAPKRAWGVVQTLGLALLVALLQIPTP